MTGIHLFDPALCCSSGVCGVDVDQALVTFSADAAWLTSRGVAVTRHNLGTEPTAFADSAVVRELLAREGVDALPAVVVDGQLRLSGRYPTRAELVAWAAVPPTPSVRERRTLSVVATVPPASCCSASDSAEDDASCC
ncbi:MAG: arsenite efflux transporter metallochaperone ArsD [Gemmatimonadota bacterium]